MLLLIDATPFAGQQMVAALGISQGSNAGSAEGP
jgi:hypothetical protein